MQQDGVTYPEGIGVEVGFYRAGGDIVIYVNQAGVCIFRERVALIPELAAAGGKVVSIETLRQRLRHAAGAIGR